MTLSRTLILLLIALCGCTRPPDTPNQDSSNELPTPKFEAEWVSIDVAAKRLFLGEKRFSLQQIEPDRRIINGNISIIEEPRLSSARDIELSATRDADTGTKIEGFDGIRFVLIRDGNRMRVISVDSKPAELDGLYEYASNHSPHSCVTLHF